MNRAPRSPILDLVVRGEFHTVLVVSVYLLFAGHNQPGGGFPAGLVAGAAFVLRFLAGGADDVRRSVRLHPFTLLGLGLLLAVVTALVPVALGGQVLEHATWSADLPLLGAVKTTSALVFDTGVYLVVVGLVVLLLTSLGDAPDDLVDGTAEGSVRAAVGAAVDEAASGRAEAGPGDEVAP